MWNQKTPVLLLSKDHDSKVRIEYAIMGVIGQGIYSMWEDFSSRMRWDGRLSVWGKSWRMRG